MKSSKSFAVVAALAAWGFAPAVSAQDVAEPPRTLAVEPSVPSPTSAINVASLRINSAASVVVEASPEPAPALADEPLAEPAAEAVAAADTTATAEMPDISADDFKVTLQVLRRLGRTIDDGVSNVSAFKERLTDPTQHSGLNLRPHQTEKVWGEVVELLYDDKCKEALGKMEALSGEPTRLSAPGLQYMWARIQMCAGQPTAGKKTLARLGKGDGPVSVLAKRRLGEKVTITEGGDEEDGMYLSTSLRAAKRTAKNDVDKALVELNKLHTQMGGRSDRFRVEHAKARVLEGAKRYDEAAVAYLTLYRKSRNWKVNGTIEDEIERLERKTKKRILTYGERIDRMRSLVKRGKYKQAKEVSIENAKIRKVGGKEIQGWMYYRLALQAEREKKRKQANELFAKADKLVKDSEVRPRLYFGWARALRRTDQDSQAVKLYGRLCAEYAKHHLCDEAKYEAGRLLQFQNKHVEAIAYFDQVVKDHADSEHTADALWRKAFSHYLLGQYARMQAPLERMRKEFGKVKDASELTLGLKATYWLAMSKYKAGELAEAEHLFQATIDQGMLTWYGRLAATRMEQAGWNPSVRLPDGRLSKDELRNLATLRVPKSPRLAVAGEFVRLGLWKDALAEMRDQVAIHPVPEGAHRLLAATYLANGRPDWAHWIMKKHIDPSGPTWSTLRDWGTAFPLDYMELAHEHGTKAGVSPFLVQAIIRQESGFRPTVSSWAGAVGLMQLMPGTAAYTARVFGDKKQKFRRNDLKRAEQNVSLGARYIRLHTAHAGDNVALALAGYNAGPRPLESWIKRYSERELDAWVESITYKEARGYVRKVYTSYVTYSALYSGEFPALDLEVPSKLPSWGDVPEMTKTEEGESVSLR